MDTLDWISQRHDVDLLGQQQVFCYNVAKLIVAAYEKYGYALTFGEAMRSEFEARRLAAAGSGISNSLHTIRLAVDLNLFQGRQFLARTDDHRILGTHWKSLHPSNAWGGDFSKPDGNHYSMQWQGRK